MVDAAAPVAESPADDDRDWSALPLDALALIFTKVGADDVLFYGVGLVCRSWLDAAKVPDVWRTFYFSNYCFSTDDDVAAMHAMVKVAVERSCGQLEVFSAPSPFDYDQFLEYVVERSPSLMDLELGDSSSGLSGIVSRKLHFPELRKLHLNYMWGLPVKRRSAILHNCPRLELLVVRYCFYVSEKEDVQALAAKCAASGVTFDWDQKFIDEDDEEYLSDDD